MPNCDLCNTETNLSQGTQVSAVEFRRLVACGLEPDDTMLAAAAAMGLSKPQALHHWKTVIVGQGRLRPPAARGLRILQEHGPTANGSRSRQSGCVIPLRLERCHSLAGAGEGGRRPGEGCRGKTNYGGEVQDEVSKVQRRASRLARTLAPRN